MGRPACWPLAALSLLLLLPLLVPAPPARAMAPDAPALPLAVRGADADFFGIVGRDPWYEWNADPARFPNDVNRDLLEGMARDLAHAGAGWVRIELHAERASATRIGPISGALLDLDSPTGPDYVDYRKWDWFIKECAPRYGLKVLLLLGQTLIAHTDVTNSTWNYARINDPPDRPDGTNDYIRRYTARAREVADHFGASVAVYEILNEPNISATLQRFTRGRQYETDPQRFGALLAAVYSSVKPAHPQAQLIVGGLLYGTHDSRDPAGVEGAADVAYLRALYRSERVQQYRAASGRYPFDGVAIHPYTVGTPQQIVAHLRLAHAVIAGSGDTGKLWLTEIGVSGTPPPVEPAHLAATPTASELAQAQFIRELFPLLLGEARPLLAHVFWFKWEDFPARGGWAEYGLVRLAVTEARAYRYPPALRKPAFAAFQQFANPAALPTAPEPPGSAPGAPRPADARFFPQTQHVISGAFRQYWETRGGLTHFGYPITSVFEVGGLRVQYFERARFEYHPGNAPSEQVKLGLLTAYLTSRRPFPQAMPQRGAVFFPQAGHNLGGAFLQHWQTTGGLAAYGSPISEELREINAADGKYYTVQYFERARFELRPANAGGDSVVLLGLMGLETLNTGGWYR